MYYSKLLVLAISAGLLDGVAAQFGGTGQFGGAGGQFGGQNAAAKGGKGGNGAAAATGAAAAQGTGTAAAGNANAGGNSALALDPDLVQTGSQSTGQDAGAEAGQAPAATDNANFINFCKGQTLTNGLQVKGGSCNGIVMGNIPASTSMISSIITNPGPADNIAANTDFNINVQVSGLVAGSFTNPDATYYSSPQDLQGGKVVGHTHVTVQSLGANNAPTTPPDPAVFAFFKGINDAGDGNGGLTAAVAGGLPAGSYRVCTMTSSSNHQPVLMPVAQRGAQDDCQKFTVGGTGGGNANAGGKTGGNAAASGAGGAPAAAATGTAGTGGKGGFGGKKGGKGRFARRAFIA